MSRRFKLRFLEYFFRHRWLNLVPLLLLSIAAVVYLSQSVYVSHASIYVQRDNLLETLTAIRIREQTFGDINVISSAQITASEFQELVMTDAFVDAVIAESDLREQLNGSPRDLREVRKLYRESFSVSVEGDNLMRLEIETDRPELAYQFATSTLNAYRSWKISRDVREGQIAQAFFAELIEPYQQDLDAARDVLRRYLEDYSDPAVGDRPVEEILQIERLQNEVRLLELRVVDVQAKAESARLAMSQTNTDVDQTYRVVDIPLMPPFAEPMTSRLLMAVVFPVVGVLLLIVMVCGRMLLDQTFLYRLDVSEELELPVLAEIKELRQRTSSRGVASMATSATPTADDALSGTVRA